MRKTENIPVLEAFIPDCCNAGVLFRILAAVSGGLFLILAARGESGLLLLQNFAEAVALMVPVVLGSVLILCKLRTVMPKAGLHPWLQRLSCGMVPAILIWLVAELFRMIDVLDVIYPRFQRLPVMVTVFVTGMALQRYFELRTRAYSPVLAEARLQALQARIRPHFLFNSLNTVLSLIRQDPRRAERVLEDLSDLFRALMRDARIMISLEDELQLCKQYLAIESVRLGERLQTDWQITGLTDADIREIQVPALLLQPLIENAVHYGVEPSLQVATVSIHLKKSLNKVDVTVKNPQHTPGYAASGNQIALDNIRQRLSLLYDVEAGMTSEALNSEFVVKLYFPAKK